MTLSGAGEHAQSIAGADVARLLRAHLAAGDASLFCLGWHVGETGYAFVQQVLRVRSAPTSERTIRLQIPQFQAAARPSTHGHPQHVCPSSHVAHHRKLDDCRLLEPVQRDLTGPHDG